MFNFCQLIDVGHRQGLFPQLESVWLGDVVMKRSHSTVDHRLPTQLKLTKSRAHYSAITNCTIGIDSLDFCWLRLWALACPPVALPRRALPSECAGLADVSKVGRGSRTNGWITRRKMNKWHTPIYSNKEIFPTFLDLFCAFPWSSSLPFPLSTFPPEWMTEVQRAS